MSTVLKPVADAPVRPMSFRELVGELRPRGRLLTPFNVVSALIVVTGVAIVAWRFAAGLGAVTNLSQEFPWGLWKGAVVVTGVAFAGGAYVVTFLVYVLGMEKYRPILRATVLNGFLAYVFYAGALAIELGRPWKMPNPLIGNDFGFSSVLFLIAWHFVLYMVAMAVELSPTVAEWLGRRRAHRILAAGTLGAVVLGITLSTLHQSGLGVLFLMAKAKIHPLWYTELIPVLFFVSSIFAGLSLVIVEGSISRRAFGNQMPAEWRSRHGSILTGLARICAGVMLAYLFLSVLALVHDGDAPSVTDAWGRWYLLETVGLVALPMVLFALGARGKRLPLIRVAAVLTLAGIVLNRLNVSVIAYRWTDWAAGRHYVPTWMEVVVMGAVVCAEIWVFRWVVLRMPIHRKPPAWTGATH
jgi:Ni/Fe-hydrogenase subunit HybB-like protein